MTKPSALTLAHVPDIAWIIALWKAIHGGDPAPDDRTAAAAILAGASAYLNGQTGMQVAVEALTSQLKNLGIAFSATQAEAPRVELNSVGLQPGGGIGTHFAQLCYGVPPNRHCVVVQLPGRH